MRPALNPMQNPDALHAQVCIQGTTGNTYCGEYGQGKCRCQNRLNYAIASHRLNPQQLDYASATELSWQAMLDVKKAMEDIDDFSQQFAFCRPYESPERLKSLMQNFLDSMTLSIVKNN